MSYVSRRYHAPVTDTPRRTSRVTPRLYSTSYGRLMFGSGCRAGASPKLLLLLGPISLSCAMPSRLVGRVCAEQVDVPRMKSQSDQLRVSVCSTVGLYLLAKSVVKLRLYLLRPNLR